jgi:hypothetical protein
VIPWSKYPSPHLHATALWSMVVYTSAHHLLHSFHSTLPTGRINTYANQTPPLSASELMHNQYYFRPIQFPSMRGTQSFDFHYHTRPCQPEESIPMQIKLLTSVLQNSRTTSIPFSLSTLHVYSIPVFFSFLRPHTILTL